MKSPVESVPSELERWPEHLYGGWGEVVSLAERRFRLMFVCLVLMFAGTVLGARSEGDLQSVLYAIGGVGGVSWAALLYVFLSANSEIVERRLVRRARKDPGAFPVNALQARQYARAYEVKVRERLEKHLASTLAPAGQEVAATLLADGYDGTVSELTELASLTVGDSQKAAASLVSTQ